MFKIEDTDNKFIMFEVKNYSTSIPRNEKKKFFADLNSTTSNSKDIYGGVFISVNGPVDVNTKPLDPKFDQKVANLAVILIV